MDGISQGAVRVECLLEMIANKGDPTLDATLNYISKILLEDDLEENDALLHEESAVSAIEKPFYDILSRSYPNTMNISEALKTPQGCQSSTNQNFSHLPGSGNEEDEDEVVITSGSGGKMKSNVDNLDHLEGRIRKVGMLCSEETTRRSSWLDKVLLRHDNYMEIVSRLKEVNLREESNSIENYQGEVQNLKRLLIRCSEAVYANNRQSAVELIEQIRNRSSLDGDAIQRMAFLYADALEARLTGTGGEAWRRLCGRRTPTSEYAKLAQLYITAVPFPRIHICFSNRTILNAAERASVLHVVDFGIAFGFQWPSLIQAMSKQNANATKIRITGVDFPRPGFRPDELVDETGRRLEDYARSFNVPFEYRGITSKNWEAISMDELNIKNDEMLVVTCMYRLKEIGDETVSLDSPRDRLLKLINEMRPHLFIEGILNFQSYSPFFLTRFRQTLPIYIDAFELSDTLIPRDNKCRKTIEQGIFAEHIMNIVACEGSDWTYKPESYKQWHRRNVRAGFEQVPLNPAIVKKCRDYLRKLYNDKIFFIEEDGNWLLQGLNGKTRDALSIWKPKLA